jgi:hypothetical protein
MTEKNVPLLLATMAMIKVFPEKHDQGSWVDPCNTTMCFAGHAAVISGATFDRKIHDDEDSWIVDPDGKHVDEAAAYEGDYWDGERKEGYKFIEEFAKDKLGLTNREADYMFHHSRTPEQLEEAVYKFAAGFTIAANWSEFVKQES